MKNIQAKDLEMAILTGQQALEHLENLLSHLESIKKWGYMDIFSKDLLPTLIKHRKMKKSEVIAKETENAIIAFQNQLKTMSISESSFEFMTMQLKITDYLLGMIGNIYVQGKIKENIEIVKDAYKEVELCLNQFKNISRE